MTARFRLEKIDEKLITVSVRDNDSNVWRYLHSRRDPLRETDRFFSHKKINDNTRIVFFLGLGAGYYLKYALEHFPDKKFVVVEPDEDYISWLEKVIDLSELRSHPNVVWIISSDKKDWFDHLDVLLDIENICRFQILKIPCLIDEKKTGEFLAAFNDAVNFRHKNFNIYSQHGKTWFKQFFENFPVMDRTLPVSTLYDSAKNLPAVLIGAGPSLNQILPAIKIHKRKIITIASDTALPVLLGEDILPDFVVSIDPLRKTNIHFGSKFPDTLSVITIPEIHPDVLRFPWKHIFLIDSSFPSSKWLSSSITPLGVLRMGGNVMSAVFSIAKKMSCSPIFFAGVDFCFFDENTHCTGTAYEVEDINIINKLSSIEDIRHNRFSADIIRVKRKSKTFLTNEIYLQYANWMRNVLETNPGDYYSLSQKTLLLDSMPYYPQEKLSKKIPCDIGKPGFRDNYISRDKLRTGINKLYDELIKLKEVVSGGNLARHPLGEWISIPFSLEILDYYNTNNSREKRLKQKELFDKMQTWRAELTGCVKNAVDVV